MNNKINKNFNPIIVIPSRLGATRLPNKPLLKINNIPMIIHVVKRALASDINNILVAAGDMDIIHCVNGYFGTNNRINAILTDPNLPSGSDRIQSALDQYDKDNNFDIVINLQGDLPTITTNAINECYNLAKIDGVDISTLVSLINNEHDKHNVNVVKAVLSFVVNCDYAKALYFSRLPVPYNASSHYHHIGIYGYKRHVLKKFTSLAPSTLEMCEKLEQLRALENGINIYAKSIEEIPLGVDTQEDLLLAEKILNNMELRD